MKNDRINYVLVGSFVLAMVSALVVVIAMLSGRTGGPTDTYFTSFADATGLKYGSLVLYMGYKVGQVEKIEPVVTEAGSVRFELELSIIEDFASWQVPKDSVAEVRKAGLLAETTVDIRAENATAGEWLKPRDHITGAERGDAFAAVSAAAQKLSRLTDTLERRGAPMVDNLARLSEELAGRAPEVIDSFLATTKDIRGWSQRLEALLTEENAAKLGSVVDNVLAASENLSWLSATASYEVDRLAAVGLAARVRRALDNVDSATADAAHVGATARAGVDTLLARENLDRVESTLENAKAASAGARDLLGPARLEKVDAVLDRAKHASGEMDAMVTETRERVRNLLGPDTVARFDRALANISAAGENVATLSAHVDARVEDVLTPEVTKGLRKALENFSLAAANVATLTRGLEESRGDLDALLVALRGIAEDNRADVRASVRDLRYSLQTVAQHIDAVAQTLEGTSRNMLEFSRRLKANPGLLLRGSPPPDGALPGGG